MAAFIEIFFLPVIENVFCSTSVKNIVQKSIAELHFQTCFLYAAAFLRGDKRKQDYDWG